MLIGSQQRLDNIIKTAKILHLLSFVEIMQKYYNAKIVFGEHEIKRVREKNCSWSHN